MIYPKSEPGINAEVSYDYGYEFGDCEDSGFGWGYSNYCSPNNGQGQGLGFGYSSDFGSGLGGGFSSVNLVNRRR